MHLFARGAFDRILLLNGQHLERLRVHRKAGINQFARRWALDQYSVHPFPVSIRTDERCK
jgi:hypothetical protein